MQAKEIKQELEHKISQKQLEKIIEPEKPVEPPPVKIPIIQEVKKV